jgi:predicted nuclease of restriction endonuclease-like RecB superfamily
MHEHEIAGDSQLDSIIRMANQIAANVPTTGAPEIEVAHHIVQFWTPEMRERLHNDVDRSKLSPIVLKAMELESVK